MVLVSKSPQEKNCAFRLISGMQTPLHFEVLGTSGPARAATLTLPHGPIQTPVFMPVGTQVIYSKLSCHQKFFFLRLQKIF